MKVAQDTLAREEHESEAAQALALKEEAEVIDSQHL